MIIQSMGTLRALEVEQYPLFRSSVAFYDQYTYDYATLYRTQPNVRTCVDFLARNIAQLGLHVFRRIGETDRQRLRDHPLARLLAYPNEYTTRYRLISDTMSDLGIYFNAYWIKILESPLKLLRVPPAYVVVKGGIVPQMYEITLSGKTYEYEPDRIVHFRGYNSESAIWGLSPLETLRRVLAEEHAMGEYREHFWRNSARQSGVIERPLEAPEWSPTARDRFKAEFEALYAGPANSGKTAVLEEGMTWKQVTFSAQESEYLLGRKLTREECARAYHIPLPMVGILDHATFSNIREQHKNLYQDCLGPWLKMLEEDIELQLLPDFEDRDGVYVEFNIAEKLQGSFEEQTQSLQSAVGRPWMTANEARARMNLPRVEEGDELVVPLNVLIGGQASPRDSAPPQGVDASPPKAESDVADISVKLQAGEIDPTLPALRQRYEEQWRGLFTRHFERQENAVIGKIPKGQKQSGWPLDSFWDAARWNRELEQDMYRLNIQTATQWGEYVATQIGAPFYADRMYEWLAESARISSENINATMRDLLMAAMAGEGAREAIKAIFETARTSRAAQLATTQMTRISNFGAHEAAYQAGVRTKTWRVNSKNPRDEHAKLDGVTVPLGELFPNGMRWPGDPNGGAENNSNCQCTVVFSRRR